MYSLPAPLYFVKRGANLVDFKYLVILLDERSNQNEV